MRILTLLFVGALCGCDLPKQPPPTPKPETATTLIPQSLEGGRFEVQFAADFDDDVAYKDKRRIYIIKDKTTGKEFIGVSGIGISELGSHTTGSGKDKKTIKDER